MKKRKPKGNKEAKVHRVEIYVKGVFGIFYLKNINLRISIKRRLGGEKHRRVYRVNSKVSAAGKVFLKKRNDDKLVIGSRSSCR